MLRAFPFVGIMRWYSCIIQECPNSWEIKVDPLYSGKTAFARTNESLKNFGTRKCDRPFPRSVHRGVLRRVKVPAMSGDRGVHRRAAGASPSGGKPEAQGISSGKNGRQDSLRDPLVHSGHRENRSDRTISRMSFRTGNSICGSHREG